MTAPEREGDAIHRRLLANDATAPSDLLTAYLDALTNYLEAKFPRVDPHLCGEAVEAALLKLIKHPASFDPQRLTLLAYLKMSARGDLLNLLEKERRRRECETTIPDIEDHRDPRNSGQGDNDPATLVAERDERDEQLKVVLRVLDVFASGLSPEEQGVLHLMLYDQERKTEVYAAVLHLTNLSPAEQRTIVHRTKDRLQKRLRRKVAADV